MEKIYVLGGVASGKTALAQKLGILRRNGKTLKICWRRKLPERKSGLY